MITIGQARARVGPGEERDPGALVAHLRANGPDKPRDAAGAHAHAGGMPLPLSQHNGRCAEDLARCISRRAVSSCSRATCVARRRDRPRVPRGSDAGGHRGAPACALRLRWCPGLGRRTQTAQAHSRRAVLAPKASRLAPLLGAIRRNRGSGRSVRGARNRVDQGRVSRYLTTWSLGLLLLAPGAPDPGLPGALGGASVGSGSASPSGKIMPCRSRARRSRESRAPALRRCARRR